MYLLDGEKWLPCARGNFLDGVENDAVWVDRNTARLDEVDTSTGDTPHEGLQGDPAIIAIDGDFVRQSRVPGPDDPHVEVSPAIGVQGPRAIGLVARNADVVESLCKGDPGPVGTLGLELQVHEAAEAIQEGSRRAGPVVGGGTTEATRSPAGSGVAAGVSGILIVIVLEHIRRQRITAHVSWGLVYRFGVQTNGLHGSGVVGVGAVAQGLSTAAETTTERTVVVWFVHHWSLIGHYRQRIVRGS
jgi:hypothetical protein